MLDAKTFVALTPSKIREMTGKKLTLTEKISLKLAQAQVKKQLRKGKEVDMSAVARGEGGGIDILWLLLGVVLGLIGVIIALITKKGSGDNRVRFALIGWLIWVAIVLVAFVL
ncbi:MAG TPA: hypothetical protein PKE63_04730 [Lacibacter sp.]|nr:hypothetical protein [Lacibacter sp.]